MTLVLVALFCTALGYFVGVAMVTASLRDDVRALDAERAQLEASKRKLERECRLADVLLPDRPVMFDLGGHKLTHRVLS